MSITPEQADQLKRDATDGPWAHDEVPGPGEDPTRATEVYAKDGFGAIAYVQPSAGDVALIAAAPDLAQTVIEQAEKIKRLQAALLKADKWSDCLNSLRDDGFLVEGDMN